MTLERILFEYSFDDVSPRYRLMHQIMDIFDKPSDLFRANVPPLLKFVSVMKDRFCSSCVVVSLDEKIECSGQDMQMIMKELSRHSERGYLCGYRSDADETFLGIILPIHDNDIPYAMVMWRKGRIFTPEDVIVAKVGVSLFFTRLRELLRPDPMDLVVSNDALVEKGSDTLTLRCVFPVEELSFSDVAWMYGEALDMVCKAVVITEGSGKLVHMNTYAKRLFGHETLATVSRSPKPLYGLDWVAGRLHPDDAQFLVESWNEAQHSESPFTAQFRLMNLSESGAVEEVCQYRRYECKARPLFDKKVENGLLRFWIFTLYDTELSRLMEEAQASAVRKTKFLAEMSHEIRTPLACVIGTCSLLRYTPLTKEQSDLLNTIRLCSQQLFTLTNNILDLAKIEESKLIIESRPVFLERAVCDVVDIFVPELVKKDIDVAVDLAYPDVPEAIMSDEGRLRQIITNVISNAIKFSNEHSTICVRIARHTATHLRFEVEDEGPGIPADIPQAQLFETFVQLDVETSRKYGGSGLGLTISKKLVNLLGGEIWYESEVGKGTKMMFSIQATEPSGLDVQEPPVDATSSYRHSLALNEFLSTMNATSARIAILLVMRKKKMTEFWRQLIPEVPQILDVNQAQLSTGSWDELDQCVTKFAPTILITDYICIESKVRQLLEAGRILAALLLEEQHVEATSAAWGESKTLRGLKRPLRPAMCVRVLHEVLLMILSGAVAKSSSTEGHEKGLADSKWLQPPSRISTVPSLAVPKPVAAKAPETSFSPVPPAIFLPGSSPISAPTISVTRSFAANYPLRIMLAEDNLLNQQLMVRILNKYGYLDVFVVDNGQQAVDLFRRLALQPATQRIDAIFMDMQMPEMEGPAASKNIRAFCQSNRINQPHIMALTAKAFSEDRDECRRAGMCSYLSKPVRWSTLEEELVRAYEAVNDQIVCVCNEGRSEGHSPHPDLVSLDASACMKTSPKGEGNSHAMASAMGGRPTGLDV